MANSSKRIADDSEGPWAAWRTRGRADRAIRFVETYCVITKGYGSGKPLKLAPFQRDWLHEVYDAGVSSAAMSIPRGNGKSTLLAALGLWSLFDPDPDCGTPQIPIVATSVGQAIRTVYGVATGMVGAHPELSSRTLHFTAIGSTRLQVPSTGGEMFPVSSYPDALQGLDPTLSVCDELGFVSQESWDSLLLASGKRPRSLVVGIGTPGFDRQNALWHLRQAVTSGVELPGFVYTEYAATEGCDVRDEDQWAIANPSLAAGYANPDALRMAVEVAPEAHFRIFRLGQWADGAESWLGPDGRRLWDSLQVPYDFKPGAPTWAGVDVGLRRDSTAVVWAQEREPGRLHAKCKVWAPSGDGTVDVTDVMQFIRQLDADFDLRAVSYDPRFFDVPAQMLQSEGISVIEIPQSLERMTPIIGNAFEALKRGEITHDHDEVFATHVLNGVCKYNERGFTLQKSKSKGRIDAAIALCLSLERYYAVPAATPVVFGWA